MLELKVKLLEQIDPAARSGYLSQRHVCAKEQHCLAVTEAYTPAQMVHEGTGRSDELQ